MLGFALSARAPFGLIPIPAAEESDKKTVETSGEKLAHMNDQLQHYENKLAYEIDSWDLKVALNNGERVTVVDARNANAFQRERIPVAINIPHREMSAESTSMIDKDSLVVTYCDGIGCNASTKGALNMLRLGFRVKELLGGLDWWKRDGHPTLTDQTTCESDGCGCG